MKLESVNQSKEQPATKPAHTLMNACFAIAADGPQKLRPCDAWRVYDFALQHKMVHEVKSVLRELNPHAFKALCDYEAEEIELSLQARAALAKAQA